MSEDITYCAYDCKNMKCERNNKHIKKIDITITHSFAYFDSCKEREQRGEQNG